jgi:hypothetical protein
MDNTEHTNKFDPMQIRRETVSRLARAGAVSLMVVALTFWGVLSLFPLTASLPKAVGSGEAAKQVDWSLLEGIASVVTLSLVIGGVIFAFGEYMQNAIQHRRESAEASFGIYREVFDRLMSSEALAARRWIILNLPTLREKNNDKEAWLACVKGLLNKCPENWEGERPPGKECLKQVLNTFDFVGFVATHYWNMENELVEWMSPSIAKVWERVYLYVEDEANRRNEPDFYQSAREFGQYCLEWRNKRYPESNIIDDAT